jgi:aspartyl-tRNA synthetase
MALTSNITKFFQRSAWRQLAEPVRGGKPGDLLLIVCDQASPGGGRARRDAALHRLARWKLIDESKLAFCWITDFPLVEWDEQGKRWHALHHPFRRAAPRGSRPPGVRSGQASVRWPTT